MPIGRVATGQVDGSGEGCTQVNKFEQVWGAGSGRSPGDRSDLFKPVHLGTQHHGQPDRHD